MVGDDVAPPQDDDPVSFEPNFPVSELEARLTARFPSMAFALRGLDTRSVWVMVVGALLLVVFRKYGGSNTFESILRPEWLKSHPYLSVYGDYYWFLMSFVMLGGLPVALSLPKSVRPKLMGLGLGDWRFGLKWLAILLGIMVPVVALVSRTSTFWKYYPLNHTLGQQAAQLLSGLGAANVPASFWAHFLAYELLYALYFVGWEYFFRGFMTFGLYARMGVNGVFVATIPFALLHVGKPFPEALGSIVAGIALGLFALRARSFWYCWMLHVAVAWTMDGAAILRRADVLAG